MTVHRRTCAMLLGAILCVALAAPVGAQESNQLIINLLDEVQRLRGEVSGIRNENEELRHLLEMLISELGIEIGDVHVRKTADSSTVAESIAAVEKPVAEKQAPEQPGEQQAAAVPVAEEREAAASFTEKPDQGRRVPGKKGAPAHKPSPGQERFAVAGYHTRSSAEERRLYLDALAHLDKDHYDGLRSALRQFLRDYPGGAYESKARYWIAESYYTEKRFDEAVSYFEEYVRRFPGVDRADDARLKLAYIYDGRGDKAAAARLLEDLVGSSNERIRTLAKRRFSQVDRESR